jgi:hypothetical protein
VQLAILVQHLCTLQFPRIKRCKSLARLVPSIISMTLSDTCPKVKTVVVVVVCFSRQPELRWFPHIDIREPSFQRPYYGYIQKHMEEYNMPHQQAEVEAAAASTPARATMAAAPATALARATQEATAAAVAAAPATAPTPATTSVAAGEVAPTRAARHHLSLPERYITVQTGTPLQPQTTPP